MVENKTYQSISCQMKSVAQLSTLIFFLPVWEKKKEGGREKEGEREIFRKFVWIIFRATSCIKCTDPYAYDSYFLVDESLSVNASLPSFQKICMCSLSFIQSLLYSAPKLSNFGLFAPDYLPPPAQIFKSCFYFPSALQDICPFCCFAYRCSSAVNQQIFQLCLKETLVSIYYSV